MADPSSVIVATKLTAPTLPDGVIPRPRITEHLDRRFRFALVSAMPGYGKTAATRHWIDTVDGAVAWLSVDLVDHEPGPFWTHLLAAIGAAVPGIDEEPARLLAERGAGDLLFVYALCAQVAGAEPLVIVVDGLPAQVDPSVLDGLALLVERGGGVARLVITARTDPSLPLARWEALGWLVNIRQDDLRVTDAEARAIAAGTESAIHDADDVAALNRRVDGWPLALHMALLSRPAGVDAAARGDLAAGSDRLLANYLLGEVLAALSDDERDAMLALSVLERFDPDLGTALLGERGAETIPSLLRRGMFLTVVEPRSATMRFHDLVRELLEMELAARDPIARVRLHRAAARLSLERGDLLSAHHHLAAVGETAQAHELLVGPALAMVDRGDLAALRRFARRLPAPAQVDSPDLAIDLAVVALYADGTMAARAWCDRAAGLIDGVATLNGPNAVAAEHPVRLHGLRCAIWLLDADLDAAVTGVRDHERMQAAVPCDDDIERRFPILAARVIGSSAPWPSTARRSSRR